MIDIPGTVSMRDASKIRAEIMELQRAHDRLLLALKDARDFIHADYCAEGIVSETSKSGHLYICEECSSAIGSARP